MTIGKIHRDEVQVQDWGLAAAVGRLEPRCAHPADGGIAPLHRCHPLSLAGPSCRHAISRPSRDLGLGNN